MSSSCILGGGAAGQARRLAENNTVWKKKREHAFEMARQMAENDLEGFLRVFETDDDRIVRKTTGMKAKTLEGLSADYEEYGIRFRQQVSKRVLRSGGGRASVAFVFRDLDPETDLYGERQLMLATFRKRDGVYVRDNYFIIKNMKEVKKICDLADGA